MNKIPSIASLSKHFLTICFLLLFPLFNVLYCHCVFAEGQTKFSQDFFDTVEPITLKDPLAVVLGAMDKEGVFVFTYADAVKFAGHSCPAVAGAYKSTQLALKTLYGKETPVRGNITVTVAGGVDSNVNGPISQIVTMITGAAADSGFKGFGPAGKYGRYNLMSFDPEQKTDSKTTCTLLFQRRDTGKKVEITYNAAIAHMDERMEKLMPLTLSGKATDEQAKLFGNLMQERVKIILLQPPEGTFTVREIQ
ncbi:MAG: hypothetical protein E3K37_15020 [Candidatus Kuenenia sp.]|nr:hypothetical protein [Candidatus Kuenenia hertensis]